MRRAIAAAALIAGAAYGARWAWNYRHPGPPVDLVGKRRLTRKDRQIWAELEATTCMEPCCIDYDEIEAYYFPE
jgi:hypothetical protein